LQLPLIYRAEAGTLRTKICGELPAHSGNTSIAVPHKNFYPQPFTRQVI